MRGASFLRLGSLCFVLSIGCASETSPPAEDAALSDAVEDVVDDADAGDASDVDVDTTPEPEPFPWVPPDDGVHARVVSVDFPVPLGHPTAGYGQTGDDEQPVSPFIDHFHATTRLHTRPGVKVLALHQGGRRVLLARAELIGVFTGLAVAIDQRVQERAGVSILDELILGATHTHAGPGRYIEHILSQLIADAFDPNFYDALVDAFADAIIDAIGPAEPVKIAHGFTNVSSLHSDRRCENGDVEDGTMGVLRVDRASDDSPLAILVNFAMHGTVLSYKAHTLSGDAPGMLEQKIAERFETPVEVLYFQSWAGDMAPGNVDALFPPPEVVSDEDPDFARMEGLGAHAADEIALLWDTMAPTDVIDLDMHHVNVPFGLDVMGYAEGEFPFPNGGAYCGGEQSECNDGVVPVMEGCFSIPADHTLWHTRVSVLRIGDLVLAPLPGEPCTPLGLAYRQQIRDASLLDDVMVLGYAQDYTGYLLDPEDWAMGGYEGASNFWGPKQGIHVAEWGAALAARLVDSDAPLPGEAHEGASPLAPELNEERTPTDSLDVGTPGESATSLALGDTWTWSWTGGDPGIDFPRVRLQRQEGDQWRVFARKSGAEVWEGGYEMILSLAPEPGYEADPDATGRTFHWTMTLPVTRRVPSPHPLTSGTYRVHVTGMASVGGALTPYEVVSAEVVIAP